MIKPFPEPPKLRLAVFASVVWFIVFANIVIFRWHELSASSLSQIGDFLGGFFAPLAFFWFVLTVLLQRKELQLTRQEMKLSREELGRQSIALEATAQIERDRLSRDEIAVSIEDIPKRITPLINWLTKLEPTRNGLTGEKLLTDDSISLFTDIKKPGRRHSETIIFLDELANALRSVDN